MTPFAVRLTKKIQEFGPLCIGLDPSASILTSCQLADTAEGAYLFCERVLQASDGKLAIIKPQSAFFERFGSAGYVALEKATALARAMGILVLLDGKRGDIDTTAEAYGQGFFNPANLGRADAVTVHAYLGFGALKKLLDYGVAQGGGVIVVVRSSNPEGEGLQHATLANGHTVWRHLANEITQYNRSVAPEGLGPVGAVVGATCADADEVVQSVPASFILAPGIGAQGATIADVMRRMPHSRGRVLPSISRGILAKGTSLAEIRTTLQALNQEAISILGS